MSKFSKILLMIWGLLAIINFVLCFFIEPILILIFGAVFGGLNMVVIISLLAIAYAGYKASKNYEKLMKEGENVQL